MTQTLAEAERSHILSVLDQTNGVISGRNGAASAPRLAANDIDVPDAQDSESFSEGPSWANGARPSLQFKARSAGIAMDLPYARLPVEEEDDLRWAFHCGAASLRQPEQKWIRLQYGSCLDEIRRSMEPENEAITERTGPATCARTVSGFLESMDRISRAIARHGGSGADEPRARNRFVDFRDATEPGWYIPVIQRARRANGGGQHAVRICRFCACWS